MQKNKKKNDLVLPPGGACLATITSACHLDGQDTLQEVSWRFELQYPGDAEARLLWAEAGTRNPYAEDWHPEEEEWEASFFLDDLAGSEDFIRELSVFGIWLEHADEALDALDDAVGRTAVLSGLPSDRCAPVALPRRRWRPTGMQRRNRRDNYGFNRPWEAYGESRYGNSDYGPSAVAERPVLSRPPVGVAFDRTWYLKA